jgi:hypothetical protein
MFLVERRALGVVAALGAVLSLVVVSESLSDSADPTKSGSDSVTAITSSRHACPSRAVTAAFDPPRSDCPCAEGPGEVLQRLPAEVTATTTSKGGRHDRCFRYVSLWRQL